MKKKVAHICLSKGYGGLEIYSLHMHQMFLDAGYPSTHFCLEDSGLEKHLEKEGLSFHCFKKAKYFNPSVSLKLRKIIKEENIGSIFVHHLRDLWVLVPALIGMPEIQIVGFAQMWLRNVNKKDFLHTKLYQRMKHLISLTDLQQEALKQCLPLAEDRYVTIPNSVFMEKYSPKFRDEALRSSLGVKEGEKLIGVIGRLDPLKGQLELVEAFSQVQKNFPNTKLLIVGDETPHEPGYKDKIIQKVKELDLEKSVILKGFQSNVNEWMASLDIFVMPSYEETFGIVLVEAMASGVPVISTKAGGVPEILNNGELGDLALPKDADSLAVSLNKYLENWDESLERANKARQVALERYDLNNVFRQVESLIN